MECRLHYDHQRPQQGHGDDQKPLQLHDQAGLIAGQAAVPVRIMTGNDDSGVCLPVFQRWALLIQTLLSSSKKRC